MWMSSSRTHESSYLAYDSFSSRLKRDLLLCVARRTAVTLTWDAPLSKAQCPGLSVSRIEPFGGFLSQFCLSSRRSLGHSLLLGQRSRLHFFSYHIRSLFHQDYGNPPTEFARHRDNGDPGSDVARMGFSHRAEKLSQLTVLADGRPRSLDQFTAQPPVSRVSDRSPLGSLSSGVLGGHQAQKTSQLADIFQLAPVPNTSQEVAGHNPADPRHRHHILYTLRQFWVGLAETANLFCRLQNLLFRERQTVEQLIELKAHRVRARQLSQLLLYQQRPLATGGSRGKLDPFHEQQRFDALLHGRGFAHQRVAQLGQMAQLAIHGRGNMNALELSPSQILRQPPTIEPIGLHSLSWRFGNHRRRRDHALISLGLESIIQSIARRSSLIGKGHLLLRKVVAHVVKQVIDTIRQAQRFQESLVSGKGHRDAPLVDVQSGKDFVVQGDECLASHRTASSVQWLSVLPLHKSTRGAAQHPSYRAQVLLRGAQSKGAHSIFPAHHI